MMQRLIMLLLCQLLAGMSLAQDSGKKDFVKGADVGFLTGQERRGTVFHDRNGKERSAWNC